MEAEIRAETAADRLLDGVGPLQGFAKAVLGPLARPYYRMEVTGAQNVPASGAAVLVANHQSMWDIPLLVIACPRPIVFMAKQEIFDRPYKDWFFTRLGGFPVGRGNLDLSAVRQALAVVRAGRVLGMYPEGTRHPQEGLLPFLPGAAWIALSVGVPIVPVGIRGTASIWPEGARWPRRAPVRIAFGEAIAVEREPSSRARRQRGAELTEELRSRVGRLLA